MALLDGKVAIVTGAGRGIGRGHARLLAAHGAAVVVNDLGAAMDGSDEASQAQQVVDEIVADGGKAIADGGNVATWKGAEALVGRAVDEFGRLDILVNNAGILRDAMSFNITEEQWDSVLTVHLKGHMGMSHFAAAHWRERGKAGDDVSGRIINTASESGLFGQAGQINYATAKAGIVGMTLVLARELKKYNVTANVICPRALTRMTSSVPGAEDFMSGPEWDPEQIAPVVGWLASDAAADISGQVFIVWGTKVHLIEGFHLVGTLDRGEGRFTPDELIARKDELFGGRRSKVPPMGIGQ
ncbi:MAG TPA: SDR family NAD(P)-dependent oxidoreductase [Acidimicrobiia bacterium]|nr:SDR family NAD(P)-dependent oxidoreductase [Acidimicrobiia bacterium]